MNTTIIPSKLLLLRGKIQNYTWGGKKYISQLLKKGTSRVKCAEYWLGAHNTAPSFITTQKGEIPLDSYIKENSSDSLGNDTFHKFGKLPFLFKVLDVKEMLSIQVHPTKKEAEKGFKLENDLGIPLSAPNRNYKDDNHKPEIMVALSEFWLLHGFLSKSKLMNVLSDVKEFESLIPFFRDKGYLGLYKKVMNFSDEENNVFLQPLIDRIVPLYLEGRLKKDNPDYWAAKAITSLESNTSFDKGIFSIYFFNLVNIQKGDAIFQDAGIPHAYLEGQNIELMANSDNVLRGGLTKKHVDVKELLKQVSFKETIPEILKGKLQGDGFERIFSTTAKDFELSKIEIPFSKVYKSKTSTPQILMLLDGQVKIKENRSKTFFILSKGESVFLKANCKYEISSLSKSIIYKAKVGS
jgi:mannose-6-phosphate isomerase